MTEIELDDFSLEELKVLRKQVEKAISDFEVRRKKEAVEALRSKASEFGYSLNELVDGAKSVSTKSAPKYFNPENPNMTWSGRGRQPAWFKKALSSGKSEKDLLIGSA